MRANKTSIVRRVVKWRWFFVVNIIIVVLLGMSLGREVVRNRSISAEITDLEIEADGLIARNIEISDLRTAMQTESFVEREARLKLGMKKPGETVLVVYDNGTDSSEGDDSEDLNDPLGFVLDGTDDYDTVTNTSKWWYYFFERNTYNALLEL
jgi:cell division protein FtsB